MDRVNTYRKEFSGLLVMCKLASGQLPQREMANKYLLVVSKNQAIKLCHLTAEVFVFLLKPMLKVMALFLAEVTSVTLGFTAFR